MEDLAKRSSGLQNLSEATKLLSSMRITNNELQIIFTSIKTQANEVEKLDITDKFAIDFKTAVALVRNRVESLESFGLKLAGKGEELNNNTKRYIRDEKTTAADLDNIVNTLQDALDMAHRFATEYEAFKKELAAAHQAARDLVESVKKQQEQKEKEASSTRNWGVAKTVGAGALGGALLAAGFFTGGATWAALAATTAMGAGGAAALGVAGSTAYSSVLDTQAMNRLAEQLSRKADQLRVVVSELHGDKSNGDKAEGVRLSSDMVNTLKDALAMCQLDHKRQQEVEEAQRQVAEKYRQLEEQQRELEELYRQMAAMQKGLSK